MIQRDSQEATGELTNLSRAERAVVQLLIHHGPLSRAELARQLDLSGASLTKQTRSMLDSGLITAIDQPRGAGRGRPGMPLQVPPSRLNFAGVKVTADHVYAVRTDAFGRTEKEISTRLTETSVASVTAQIVHLVKELGGERELEAVGIGAAGHQRQYDTHVRSNEFLGWDSQPLAHSVCQELGIPTVISGDVRGLATGLQWSEPTNGLRNFAVLTVGVGVGLALVLDGKVHTSDYGASGVIGHLRVADSGPLCPAGHRGCAHAYLATDSLTDAIGAALHHHPMEFSTAIALAREGNPIALRTFADAGAALGTIIAQLANLLALDAVVLAGETLDMLDFAREHLERTVTDKLDPQARGPEVFALPCSFTEWARGAAVVAREWLLNKPPAP